MVLLLVLSSALLLNMGVVMTFTEFGYTCSIVIVAIGFLYMALSAIGIFSAWFVSRKPRMHSNKSKTND